MILTASVETLSTSLSRWEWGEYISEAFVIIACAGELIADLKSSWLTEESKKHLQRRSTILLVAALSISLICLVRTNELSGSVIGSLGEKAEDADTKAAKALTDSGTAQDKAGEACIVAGDALTKAGKASDSLGKAEDEARSAQMASSSAVTLAGQARKEADSFEADIKSAKDQAAKAEQHLADALRETAEAQEALDRIKTPRSLINIPEMVASLAVFKGTKYVFISVVPDEESITLLKSINEVLKQSGWERDRSVGGFPGINPYGKDEPDFAVPAGFGTGVRVSIEFDGDIDALLAGPFAGLPRNIQAASALHLNLSSNIIPSPQGTPEKAELTKGISPVVRIAAGSKPLK